MVKRSQKQQDEDKKKVVDELQSNAREELDTIAKHCGFSRQKVWRIIKELETEGSVWGYTAIADLDKRDSFQFTILIKKTSKPLDTKIVDAIDSITLEEFVSEMGIAIESSYFVHGNYDWLISVIAKDIKQVRKFCEELYKAFPGVIEKIEILQTLYAVRKHYIFNPDRKKLHELI